ncbi:MAG: nucleoside hydrolase, partial [Limosilactobacillus fermentum]
MTTKIIMDTDPGIDDAAALTMAINDPSLDLKLITTVAGNVTVDKTTANALKIVNFFGKNDQIPVAGGAVAPLIKPFEDARKRVRSLQQRTILFLDEIHRFNK